MNERKRNEQQIPVTDRIYNVHCFDVFKAFYLLFQSKILANKSQYEVLPLLSHSGKFETKMDLFVTTFCLKLNVQFFSAKHSILYQH